MTYIEINPKMKAKDLAALPSLAAALDQIADADEKKADDAIANMPATLTAGCRKFPEVR